MRSYNSLMIIIIASLSFSNSFAGHQSIPFEYYQGLIFLEIQTEAQDTLFCLFDTGAEISAIDDKTSERLQLPVVGSAQVTGTTATINIMVVNISHLKLGDYFVDSINPTKRDLTHSLSPNNRHLDMILGYDFFQNAIVEIDFINNKLRIHHDSSTLKRTAFINFTLDHNIPRFSGLVNGKIQMDFRLDTGASLFETDDVYINITTNDWNAIKKDIPALKPESYLYATGITSEQVILPVVRLEKITIGEFEIDNPYVIVQPEQGYFALPDAVGFISNNLLSKYDIVAIDYINNRLYISE